MEHLYHICLFVRDKRRRAVTAAKSDPGHRCLFDTIEVIIPRGHCAYFRLAAIVRGGTV